MKKTLLALTLFATFSGTAEARAERSDAWDDPKSPVELGLPANAKAPAKAPQASVAVVARARKTAANK